MNKTFNIYCDESCHLENDHKPFMFLGSVSSAYNQVKLHTERINELKQKHHFNPTPADGINSMERLFTHLTTKITDKSTRKRSFDLLRSERMHWIKFHIEERKESCLLVFSVHEPEGKRTYLYDRDEKYVIVLEPLRKKDEYYLLTAYCEEGKDKERGKIMRKYSRRLPDTL